MIIGNSLFGEPANKGYEDQESYQFKETTETRQYQQEYDSNQSLHDG